MANTLTNLLPDLYEALDVVSREMVGFIPAVNTNHSVERASLNQSVYVPIAPAASTATNTAATTAPDTGDQTMETAEITISKSKHVAVRWNGEETLGLSTAGTFSSITADRFAQAMRTIVNEIEVDLATEAYQSASRGYGTAGTTPFGTAGDMTDFAGAARILDENGAPTGDRQLALGHAAMANLRGVQNTLFRVNEAGSADMLRNGMTDRVQGFAIRHSEGIVSHTKGTGTGYLINNGSGEAVGQTTLTVDTGSNTIIAGDVITIAGDSDKYIVGTALAAGDVIINKPGLRTAAANNAAVTVGNSYTANVAFSRSAIALATRAPALPASGDMATDTTQVTDPVSGLTFEIAEYKQFLQTVFHVRLAWGQAAIKPEHIANLLG